MSKITKEEAINELEYGLYTYAGIEIDSRALRMGIKAIKDSIWIPCSKRLPKKSGAYLTTCKVYVTPDHTDEVDNYTDIKILYYDVEFGWERSSEVYAWMPLPQKYK